MWDKVLYWLGDSPKERILTFLILGSPVYVVLGCWALVTWLGETGELIGVVLFFLAILNVYRIYIKNKRIS